MKIFLFLIFNLLFLISFCYGGDIPVAAPFYEPQLSTLFGRQIESAKVHIPLQPLNDPASSVHDLSLLTHGFVCHAPSPQSPCTPSPPSCRCDFTLPCASLPSCCQSDPATAAVWSSACADAARPSAWTSLTPTNATLIVAQPRADSILGAAAPVTYLRYHPSASSACRGFGFTIRPPKDGVSGDPTLFIYIVSLSFSHARPEEDPSAWTYTFKTNPWAEGTNYPRFCPFTYPDAQPWFAPYLAQNDRTVFISVVSATPNVEGEGVPVPARFTLFESNDVSAFTFREIVALDSFFLPVQPRETLSVFLSNTGNGGFPSFALLTYVHQEPSCKNVILSSAASSSGDLDIFIVNGSTAAYATGSTFNVASFQTGFDVRVVNLCPGDYLGITLSMYFGDDHGLFTLAFEEDAAVEAVPLSALHPLLLSPYLATSTQLNCDASAQTAASHFNDVVPFVFPCSSWDSGFTGDCSQYIPLAPIRGGTLFWPPPPKEFLPEDIHRALLADQVARVFDATLLDNTLLAHVMLSRTVFETNAASSDTFFRWEHLSTCRVAFNWNLVNQHGDRLSDVSPAFLPIQAACQGDTQAVSEARAKIDGYIDLFGTPAFQQANFSAQTSAMLEQSIIYGNSQLPYYTYLLHNSFLNTSSSPIGAVQQPDPSQCDAANPCCPTTGFFNKYFFDFCVASQYYLEHSVLQVQHPDPSSDLPDSTCVSALLTEYAYSQQPIANPSLPSIPCSLDQSGSLLLRNVLTAYYQTCKSTFLGDLDNGLPCDADTDCPHPGMRCLLSPQAPSHLAWSTGAIRRAKTCQAPTSLLDELVFGCLVETMPVLLVDFLQDSYFHAPVPPAKFNQTLRQHFFKPGCVADVPSSPLALAPTLDMITLYGIPCDLLGSCPQPFSCLDPLCSLPYTCTGPLLLWQPCAHFFSSLYSFSAMLATEAQCDAQSQCNVRDTAAVPPPCPDGQASCQAQCESAYGPSFCGYCDPATQACFRAPSLADEASCQAASDYCYHPDLGLLAPGPCAGLGSCSHFLSPDTDPLLTTAAECHSRPGLCVQPADRRAAFLGGGCLGHIGYDDSHFRSCAGYFSDPNIYEVGRISPAGCLFLDTTNAPLYSYPDPASCDGAPDPFDPSATLNWIGPVSTQAACLDDPRLHVCVLPFNDSTPQHSLPNQNLPETCTARGGTVKSPFEWELPSFTPGQTVTLSWTPTVARPVAHWESEHGRFDYHAFSDLITSAASHQRAQADLLTSICTYSNSFQLASDALVCDCASANGTAHSFCLPFKARNEQPLPPSQVLGTQLICSLPQIQDGFRSNYPSDILIPPASLSLSASSTLSNHDSNQFPCTSLTMTLISNSRFLPERIRIRETSFFLARQDVHFPALATFSQQTAVNGRLISDGVQITDNDSATRFTDVTVCLQPRQDFLDNLAADPTVTGSGNLRFLDFGLLKDWIVQPLKRSSAITVTYFYNNSEIIVADSELAYPLQSVIRVCRLFDSLEIARNSRIYTLVLVPSNPQANNNGFNTAETVWLYITAAFYLGPAVILSIPLIFDFIKNLKNTAFYLSAIFLFCAMIFRATLLFCLADSAVNPAATVEFALSDTAILCEFLGVSLMVIHLIRLINSLGENIHLSLNKNSIIPLVIVSNVFLWIVFVAFLIAYGTISDPSVGISSPTTFCLGRLPDGSNFWSDKRILRFTFEMVLALFSFILGLFHLYIAYTLHAANMKIAGEIAGLYRLSVAALILAIALLSHTIISVILLGTEYNNYIFGITMLWVTELVPIILFLLLCFWSRLTHSKNAFIFSISGTRSGGSRSGSPATHSN